MKLTNYGLISLLTAFPKISEGILQVNNVLVPEEMHLEKKFPLKMQFLH
jgi:hypothetical protein